MTRSARHLLRHTRRSTSQREKWYGVRLLGCTCGGNCPCALHTDPTRCARARRAPDPSAMRHDLFPHRNHNS